jgi:hypothetical protein
MGSRPRSKIEDSRSSRHVTPTLGSATFHLASLHLPGRWVTDLGFHTHAIVQKLADFLLRHMILAEKSKGKAVDVSC